MHLVATLALSFVLVTMSASPAMAQDVPQETAQIEAHKEQEIRCLQKNIYFEARGEGVEGMKAVAAVTMNRVNSEEFPDTVCATVKQRSGRRCQFSWVCAGLHRITDQKAWETAGRIAVQAINGTLTHRVGDAMFFHNTSVPNFRKKPIARIGNHVFYP